jgi:hypothetical protein
MATPEIDYYGNLIPSSYVQVGIARIIMEQVLDLGDYDTAGEQSKIIELLRDPVNKARNLNDNIFLGYN